MGLSLRGTTSGAIDINPPAVAGDNAITLPASNGSANQFFKNSGTAGIVTYSSMVENSGKIGIGTAQPVNKFQVGIDTTSFNILSNGLVGIGTTDPNIGGRLSVVVLPEPGRGAINIQNHEVGSGKTNIVMRSLDNNGGNWAGAEFRAEGYSFKIRTTERFIFGFYGELGLGLPNTPGYSGPNYGTSGQVLKSQGIGAGVTWADASATQNFTGIVTATSFQVNSTTGDGSDRGFAQKYYITSSGSSGYRFAGPGLVNTTNNPTLYLHRGFTYIFENSTGSGHPFELRVSTNGAAYQPGGNFLTGSTSGTQILTVPMNAPNSIVYQCTIHSGMVGTINFPT